MSLKPNAEFNVAIVGAGFGGLATAIGLKTKWSFSNFVIYERGDDVGGTWRDNTYPGCASDVPIHFYALSTDPKSDWERSHGTQPEILEYLRDVTDKYGLRAHCRFHTSVNKVEWDADASVWRIETLDVRTGDKQLSSATAIVSAIGILAVPRFPKLRGVESFKGEVFHSARWRHDVDLREKRVGVLGNGASAVQFIPMISKDPTVKVVNFVRTPWWFVEAANVPYSKFTKWALAHVPLVRLIHRFLIAARLEIFFLAFRTKGNNYANRLFTKISEKYMKSVVPPKYREVIIPKYPMGCRLVLRDLGYLESLKRSNMRLTFDHIAHVEPDGVVTETGEKIHLDVLIYGTGFITDHYPLNARGTRGTLKEYNDAHGGPTAYLGSTVPSFPNFFMMLGPNVTPGHSSVVFSEESQVNYLLQLFEPLRSGTLKSVVPSDAATEKYNDMLQGRLQDMAWSQCASWYRVGTRGRIITIFPGPLVLLWWWLRKPRWEDYEVEGPGSEEWRHLHARRSSSSSLSYKVWFAVAILVGVVLSVLGLSIIHNRRDLSDAVN